MPMLLIPLNGGDPIPLEKAITFFGRHPDCDAVLVTSRKVSRKHCVIAQVNRRFVVRDLGSMNGVRVNGQPARGDVTIQEGDELYVGDVGFKLKIGPKPEKSVRKSNAQPLAKPPMPGTNVKRPPGKTVSPHMLSQDIPVVIADDEAEFIVEGKKPSAGSPAPPPGRSQRVSKPRAPQDSDDVIVLSEDDIIGD